MEHFKINVKILTFGAIGRNFLREIVCEKFLNLKIKPILFDSDFQ